MKVTEESSKDSVMILDIICLVFSITHACVCSPILGQSLRILSNVSVPCAQLEVDPNGYPVTHVELNDDDKVKILQQQGGAYANLFLAKTKAEADQNLPSLVALDSDTKSTHMTKLLPKSDYVITSIDLLLTHFICACAPCVTCCVKWSIWPRYINEAVCLPHDSSCLLVQGIHTSRIVPGERDADSRVEEAAWFLCAPHDERTNGVSIVTDHWLKETISIRVGLCLYCDQDELLCLNCFYNHLPQWFIFYFSLYL
ncbi:hypothetical protein CAPTEDRAFT_222200 [Capitella teleta]|uniref:Uncharacterized protein n=1 Tax=Capitella teleta TaxID=283909 RepID=R7U6K2_CAPTE|nr:hypothetical protein CAPTEDRAFT_222200 [Capitella teleta]|eukprot:ELU01766.1 hypothetical protein CAPTEDRAFT_222200 [Capitella teleta]